MREIITNFFVDRMMIQIYKRTQSKYIVKALSGENTCGRI